jgi:hypothetical protein
MALAPSAGKAGSTGFSATGYSDLPGFGDSPYASGPYAGSTPNQLKNAGMTWDAPTQKWVKSPTTSGQQAGQYVNGYLSEIPSISGLLGGIGGTGTGSVSTGAFGSGGTGSTGTGGGGSSAPQVPGLQMPDTSAATTAAFARAKDQAGQMTRASLDSLADEMGANHMLGSGGQMQGMVDALTKGTNLMGEESRSEAEKQADLAEQTALANYTGGITQRGQDMSQQTAYRGQDVAAQDAQARLALESRQQIMSMLSLALQGLKPPSGLSY